MTAEEAHALSLLLMAAAGHLGQVEAAIRAGCRSEPAAFIAEQAACDHLTGDPMTEMQHALKALAMRLNRNALGDYLAQQDTAQKGCRE